MTTVDSTNTILDSEKSKHDNRQFSEHANNRNTTIDLLTGFLIFVAFSVPYTIRIARRTLQPIKAVPTVLRYRPKCTPGFS